MPVSIPHGRKELNVGLVFEVVVLCAHVCVCLGVQCPLCVVDVCVCTQVRSPMHVDRGQGKVSGASCYCSLPYYFEAGFLPELQTHVVARLATNKPQ